MLDTSHSFYFFFTSLVDFSDAFFSLHIALLIRFRCLHQYGTCTICVPSFTAVRPLSEKCSISNWMHRRQFETHLWCQCCKNHSFYHLWNIRLLWLLFITSNFSSFFTVDFFLFFSVMSIRLMSFEYWTPGHDSCCLTKVFKF